MLLGFWFNILIFSDLSANDVGSKKLKSGGKLEKNTKSPRVHPNLNLRFPHGRQTCYPLLYLGLTIPLASKCINIFSDLLILRKCTGKLFFPKSKLTRKHYFIDWTLIIPLKCAKHLFCNHSRIKNIFALHVYKWYTHIFCNNSCRFYEKMFKSFFLQN